MEFGLLSALTGNHTYLAKADAAAKALYERRSGLGLVGRDMHLDSGAWTSPEATIGPGVDSYYEYLLKVGGGGALGVQGGGREGTTWSRGQLTSQHVRHCVNTVECCMGMALGVVLQSLFQSDACCWFATHCHPAAAGLPDVWG